MFILDDIYDRNIYLGERDSGLPSLSPLFAGSATVVFVLFVVSPPIIESPIPIGTPMPVLAARAMIAAFAKPDDAFTAGDADS